MKTDKFVRVILVLIFCLLFLNFFKDSNSARFSIPFLETKANASTPSFLQNGEAYSCETVDGKKHQINIKAIDSDGWVKGDYNTWFNSTNFTKCIKLNNN